MELDLSSKEQERFSAILTSTISSLCKNGMINSTVARVDGLLGITLANKIVFLVKVQEQLCETEVCRRPSDEQNCNTGASNDTVWTGEPPPDSEFHQMTISNVQGGVLIAPSELQVENELNINHGVDVVSGEQAADVGSSCLPDHNISDRVKVSACLQKRKNKRKPNLIERREFDESVPRMLEVGVVSGEQAADVGSSCLLDHNISDRAQISDCLQKWKNKRIPTMIERREWDESVPRMLEVGVVYGVEAADVGSSCLPDHNISDRVQVSACLQKRKNKRKPNMIERRDLAEWLPTTLEDREEYTIAQDSEENTIAQDSEEISIAYEPHYLEDLADILCDGTGTPADAYVKMECYSEDEMTHDRCPSQEIDASQVNQSEHFESETQCSNAVLSDVTLTTPRVLRTTRQVKTIPQVVRTTPKVVSTTPQVLSTNPPVVRTTPQVVSTTPQVASTTPQVVSTTPQVVSTTPQIVHRPTASNKRTHSPPVADVSRSRSKGPPGHLPKFKQCHQTGGRSKTYKQYNKDALTAAFAEVINRRLKIGQAAELFGIPQSTLNYFVKRQAADKNSVLQLK